MHDDLYARLQWKQKYAPERRFKALVENKSGVITVDSQDQIYGHGVYDGAFNVRLEQDTNGVVRAYALSGLHPACSTCASSFPHVLRVFNFMVASDAPIHLDEARFRGALERWTLAGKPVFELTRAADRLTIERAIASLRPHLEDEVALRARTARFEVITDDNMGTEWEDRASHPSTSPFAAQVR